MEQDHRSRLDDNKLKLGIKRRDTGRAQSRSARAPACACARAQSPSKRHAVPRRIRGYRWESFHVLSCSVLLRNGGRQKAEGRKRKTEARHGKTVDDSNLIICPAHLISSPLSSQHLTTHTEFPSFGPARSK